MLNRITIAGRLAKAPESRTVGEHLMARIRIACSRDYRNAQNEREADFFDVIAWRKTAELLANNWQKGDPIIIDGRLMARQYTDKNGESRTSIYIEAESVYFCGGKNAAKKEPDNRPYAQRTPPRQTVPNIEAFPDFEMV